MASVGQTFTTAQSGVTGVIKEVHPRSNGEVLLLDVNGSERWTTAK